MSLAQHSMGAMVEAARGTGLSVRRVRDIGPDYAITLRAWRAAWEREKQVRRQVARASVQSVLSDRLRRCAVLVLLV